MHRDTLLTYIWSLQIVEDANKKGGKGLYVQNLSEKVVETPEDVHNLMKIAQVHPQPPAPITRANRLRPALVRFSMACSLWDVCRRNVARSERPR